MKKPRLNHMVGSEVILLREWYNACCNSDTDCVFEGKCYMDYEEALGHIGGGMVYKDSNYVHQVYKDINNDGFPEYCDAMVEKNLNVIADDMYSWEEYTILKEKYKDKLKILHIFSSPQVRYDRLTNKEYDPKKDKKAINRPYTAEETESRDHYDISKLNKGGPIAMADYTIINEGSAEELKKKVEELIKQIG